MCVKQKQNKKTKEIVTTLQEVICNITSPLQFERREAKPDFEWKSYQVQKCLHYFWKQDQKKEHKMRHLHKFTTKDL